ncbi:PIN domain-containing protein [Hyalangium rubrum]|uniref:PIN domain-containing protein n=1 Tax=Hyalangium rubrum TaxID=3103134 RepID=A0ABU5HCW7_9BACT|nr:PIN domain-containing protein [Hyalangium sp. s54d21]MDY7231302.1 PIN domain-containing protein [Hyalangium sp. s54d21]
MSFVVLYDACVLYPAPLRDLLVRLGLSGLVQAKWTEQILDECFRSIARQRPELAPRQLERSRRLLSEAIPDCMVTGHEALVGGLSGLPDADDRHVVAAAIRCGAQVIVTFNLKDFPGEQLARYAMEAQHPDDFVLSLIDLDAAEVARVIREQSAALKNPPRTVAEVLELLRHQGLARSVARLKEFLGGG